MKKFKILLKISSFLFLGLVICYFGLYLFAKIMPKLKIESANSFYIYDKDNSLFPVNNTNDWISLDNISKHLVNATLAVEDKNFYNHLGFDFLRIIKALYINFTSGEKRQGASTISQQYVKNLYLVFDKTWDRKIEEAWLTVRLESHYSKEDILEGYLNTINYGGIFGIENAASYYFNKSAKDLNLAEAAMLAGIPKSPSNYSPLVNEELAKKRQKLILQTMLDNKMITEYELEEAVKTELIYNNTDNSEKLITLMYYHDAVITELKSINKVPSSFLKTGGLKIYTNLDLKAQTVLEQSIKRNMVQNPELQVASIVMEPNTGNIIALAGGTDYSKTQFNRVTSTKRQVGSTIKPLLYYAALENGFTPGTTFTSEKTTFTFSENKTYSPKNFGDTYGNKPISMAAALTYSDNIYAVKTHVFLGEETLVEMGKRVGIKSELEPLPSLALGAEEISITEMIGAYSTFANEGYKITPHLINKVEDMNGNVLYEFNEIKERVLNKSIVFIVNEMLNNCYAKEFIDYNYPTCFSMAPKLSRKYAIKTGTTDFDHMILGYNKNLIVAVWNGYDDNRPTENSNGVINKQIWIDTVEYYLEGTENAWYDMPKNVVGVLSDPISGKIATDSTKNKKILYYIKGTEPYEDEGDLDDLIPTVKED